MPSYRNITSSCALVCSMYLCYVCFRSHVRCMKVVSTVAGLPGCFSAKAYVHVKMSLGVCLEEAQTLARPVLQLRSEELTAPCNIDWCGQQAVAARQPKLARSMTGQHKKTMYHRWSHGASLRRTGGKEQHASSVQVSALSLYSLVPSFPPFGHVPAKVAQCRAPS